MKKHIFLLFVCLASLFSFQTTAYAQDDASLIFTVHITKNAYQYVENRMERTQTPTFLFTDKFSFSCNFNKYQECSEFDVASCHHLQTLVCLRYQGFHKVAIYLGNEHRLAGIYDIGQLQSGINIKEKRAIEIVTENGIEETKDAIVIPQSHIQIWSKKSIINKILSDF